ncbi:MAG: pyridoxal phosphate-dependent aminotransferase [Planctomycetes bacterium]|nr:pyridoxal phosphate-dependent aminotransferase [Planctomycetota bacterium]
MKERSPISRRARAVEESVTLAMTERAARLRAEGMEVLSFSAGEPDFETPEHIKQAAVEAMAKGYTRYTPSSGIPALRKAVAAKFRRDNGLDYEPAQVVISCGAKHAIFNAFLALLDPRDEVLIPSPYWTSYPEMVKSTGAKPVLVRGSEEASFKVAAKDLEAAVTPKTKLLIHCSPVNPTGAVYSRAELEAIAKVAVERGLWVISDEVYEKIVYGSTPHISIASLGPEIRERTVTVNSCSKTYSMTGWRIGYSAGPPEIMEAVAKIQSQSTSNPNSIAQYAAVAAFEGDQSFVAGWVAEYSRRRDVIVQRLQAIPGLSLSVPEGAFYAFPRVSALFGRRHGKKKIRNSAGMADLLLDEGHVAVVPGEGFGSDAHIRLSYATSMDCIQKGMDRLEEVVRSLA